MMYMTREEAIANLNMISVAFVEPVTKEQRKLINDTFEMAIQALSQEPKTVTWNIKEIADALERHGFGKLEQEPKTEHWIEERDDYGEIQGWHCSECYEDTGFTTDCKWNYCPNCGARMVKPPESEVEECDI